MKTVVQEVVNQMERMEYKLVYADVQEEITNQYGVTHNPTLVFLDEQERECYRVEGFKETQKIIDIIQHIDSGELTATHNIQNALVRQERYTVYLFKGNKPVPVEMTYTNKTAVVAPRITAIRQLLAAKKEGLENPFPPNSELLEIDFADHKATIKIQVHSSGSSMAVEKMQIAVLYTLGHFGIQKVNLQFIRTL
nr:GerMN domain-containing protein [Paenibacillus tianjinensis]